MAARISAVPSDGLPLSYATVADSFAGVSWLRIAEAPALPTSPKAMSDRANHPMRASERSELKRSFIIEVRFGA